ncbi:Hpt domain-containing protein [Ketobacter sp. MCCC 1A13808]|uniref:Hpt domain-containing protein n=1 Tax=Ketobacter sp. MCCC 1A13808 TaxID=2602738 RepID=UPI000F206106|nr:Hpt domain-containing protein [Ketobacter sp. MCCC 1A13808]MVF12850.1 Hpt domain-containing protein [Ketobacter sp. MCCC 1A13808]RLP54476.1 MAG: Hpt domain-containing protein [Ketobacter sp.]
MTNPEDHLDVAALQDLKEIMESEYETLVNTFIADTQSKLVELEEVIQQQDPENLRKIAHSLKGSSSNVCALKLSEFARQLESMGKEGEMASSDTLLSQLKVEFAEVSKILINSM